MRASDDRPVMRVAGLADPRAERPAEPGVAGNERLTSQHRGGPVRAARRSRASRSSSLDSLLTPHIFVGVVLIPPILLKVATTGYRLVRYYRGSAPYVRRGPPPMLLRVLGPLLVLSTGALLGTGVALLVVGPGDTWCAACTRSAS